MIYLEIESLLHLEQHKQNFIYIYFDTGRAFFLFIPGNKYSWCLRALRLSPTCAPVLCLAALTSS